MKEVSVSWVERCNRYNRSFAGSGEQKEKVRPSLEKNQDQSARACVNVVLSKVAGLLRVPDAAARGVGRSGLGELLYFWSSCAQGGSDRQQFESPSRKQTGLAGLGVFL